MNLIASSPSPRRTGRPVTQGQSAVLRAMAELSSEGKAPPSLETVASYMGITKATVHQHLRALAVHGLVYQMGGRYGPWRLTISGDGRCPCCGRSNPAASNGKGGRNIETEN